MKTKLLVVFVCGLTAVVFVRAADSAKPAGQVTVTFVAPEKFTDVKNDLMDSDRDRDYLLGEIRTSMESIARNYLHTGQQLEIKVTDLDLAGGFEPWRGLDFDHIRILKEIYPPRMELEFRLVGAAGQIISEGKRSLRDLGYLMNNTLPASDPLRYDKEMIRVWLRQEFKHAS